MGYEPQRLRALMEEAREIGYCIVIDREGPDRSGAFIARAYKLGNSAQDFTRTGASAIEALETAVKHARELAGGGGEAAGGRGLAPARSFQAGHGSV